MNILQIYQQDQYHVKRWDKHYTDKEFYAHNRELRKKLDHVLKSQKRLTARELWLVGMVFHHGFTLSSSKRALAYAFHAYEQGYKPAKTLIAQATDRLLQLQGRPQLFGTQGVQLKNGTWKHYRTDPRTTDKERKEYGLPPLKTLVSYFK